MLHDAILIKMTAMSLAAAMAGSFFHHNTPLHEQGVPSLMSTTTPYSGKPLQSTVQSTGTPPVRLLHPRWMLASGNFLFHLRNGLFPIIFLLILVLLRPAYFLDSPMIDHIVMSAGALVALMGQFVRFFVIGYAYIRRGGKKRRIHADRLVIAGLYAHVRNPMYVGNLLIAYGFSLYFGSVWMCAFTIPFFTWVYLAITAAEEQYLLGKFGPEYEAYMRQVNRFWPNLKGLSESLGGNRFRWKEALSKEYGTLCATLTGLTVVAMWKDVCIFGWEVGKVDVEHLAWLLIPWSLFYGTARFMKVTGRLREAVPMTGPYIEACTCGDK